MTRKEILDAADAMMSWFESQEIAPSDAVEIMARTIAGIISIKANDAEDKRKGAAALHKDILNLLRD